MVHIRRGDINRYGHGGFILRVQRIVATIQCGAGATLLLLPVHHPTTPSGRTQVRTSAARALVTFREMEALAFWAERRPRRVSRAGRQSWAGTTVETAGKVRRKAPLAAPAFACRREAAHVPGADGAAAPSCPISAEVSPMWTPFGPACASNLDHRSGGGCGSPPGRMHPGHGLGYKASGQPPLAPPAAWRPCSPLVRPGPSRRDRGLRRHGHGWRAAASVPRLADRAGEAMRQDDHRALAEGRGGRQACPLALCLPCRGPFPGWLGRRWLDRFGGRGIGGQRSGRLEAEEVRHRVPPDWIFGLRRSGGWQWLLRDLAHGLATLPCLDGSIRHKPPVMSLDFDRTDAGPPVTGAPITSAPARRPGGRSRASPRRLSWTDRRAAGRSPKRRQKTARQALRRRRGRCPARNRRWLQCL